MSSFFMWFFMYFIFVYCLFVSLFICVVVYLYSCLRQFQGREEGFEIQVQILCFVLRLQVRFVIRKRWYRWQDKYFIRVRVVRVMFIFIFLFVLVFIVLSSLRQFELEGQGVVFEIYGWEDDYQVQSVVSFVEGLVFFYTLYFQEQLVLRIWEVFLILGWVVVLDLRVVWVTGRRIIIDSIRLGYRVFGEQVEYGVEMGRREI